MSTARNMLQSSSSIWNRNTEPLGNKLFLIIFSFIDDDKSGFILEIIDGRELPEYMTMNKGKICG